MRPLGPPCARGEFVPIKIYFISSCNIPFATALTRPAPVGGRAAPRSLRHTKKKKFPGNKRKELKAKPRAALGRIFRSISFAPLSHLRDISSLRYPIKPSLVIARELSVAQVSMYVDRPFMIKAPSLATVYNWLNEFKRGRNNLTNDLRERRPKTLVLCGS
ncbi:hypothetical protein EVAR_66297_1 [Eumeta japonica]|uniref:Uncharacterized protein n=1 Tax=Eumeta variegata TaxID=151549 RepID=A0A4C1YPS7_EUMVA|nr:hypothetical protein EVAR_66297_1 [Eumeta japonica]